LIDDIQFLAGKESTQEEFFHTFNSLYDAHRQIVITSDRPPRELKDLEERLVSRFSWGLVADIHPPDFETRAAILRRKAERENLVIPDEVILLIAERIRSNVRVLEGSLVRLSARASLGKVQITLELAEDFLKDLMSPGAAANLRPEDILACVARRFDMGADVIRGKRRTSRIVLPRQIGMYLTKRLTGAPYAEIGAFYGGRDHTTVLYGCEKIDRLRADDPDLDRQLVDLTEQLKAPRGEGRARS
jgi:chromosomal replication initiator protein